jgi:hypothetical protein
MAMIFDQFADLETARAFAASVGNLYRVECPVFENRDDSDAADPFPFGLAPPIVHVPRMDARAEERVQQMARTTYGAMYAGT